MRRVEVVICTRNRARLLERACEAVLGQDYPAELWGLLIVDNASTDDTFDLARSLAQRFHGRVRAVQNQEVGHSASRNAGLQATRADIIAFTDDDALPDPCWLRTLVEVMDQERAQAGGGPVDLALTGELPPWFLNAYLPYLAIWRPGEKVTRLSYNEYPRGVNMAFRREAFEKYGPFSSHLGLRGERQLYCEEIEVCLRIERNGGVVVYSPSSRVRHCVEAGRFTASSLARRFGAQGRSEAIVNWMHGGWRGLLRGSRVHLALARGVDWRWLRPQRTGDPETFPGAAPVARSPDEFRAAARTLSHCRRSALLGYLREIPVAMATVPRYPPPAGSKLERWSPPGPR
jgi:glycosyltransferase involved in cell wall biosynthesis